MAISFRKIYEDSQDAGYSTTLETPRELGPKDVIFVDQNRDRDIGQTVLNYYGEEIKGSEILRNDPELFQYRHRENPKEIHYESVELYRNLWVSIHIPK